MESKKLLEEVIKENLKVARDYEIGCDEQVKAFKQAMEAIDRCIELDKIEDKKKEQKENKLVKYIEIIIPIGLTAAQIIARHRFMKAVCNFEKNYTFTTTPGRSISSFFKFK